MMEVYCGFSAESLLFFKSFSATIVLFGSLPFIKRNSDTKFSTIKITIKNNIAIIAYISIY